MKLFASTVAALWVVAGCGPDPVVLPTPPMQTEMAALLAAYDSPTGTFDTANAEETLMRAQVRLDELQLDWLPQLMSEVLARIDSRLDDNGLSGDPATPAETDEDRPIIDAYATVHRICKGWVDTAGQPDEATNGSIDITAVVEDGFLNRAAWGAATNCHARMLPAGKAAFDGYLDGTVVLHLEGALTQDVSQARFLFYLTGSMGVAGRMASGSFDFRFIEGMIEYRLQQPDGGDIVIIVGVTTIGVRDRTGMYSCDLVTRVCTHAAP
jgi:hypothetical protein